MLKKSDGLLRQVQRVRFGFIAAEKARYPVRLLCRCLGVTRSGFYAWCRRAPSLRSREDLMLTRRLRVISFFSSLKAELVSQADWRSHDEAEVAVASYLRFYNHQRLHSALDYRSPVTYQAAFAVAV